MGESKQKAVRGIFWSGLEKIGKQGIQFVLGIIIARMLSPSDYGIIGMLGVFMALSQVFLDSGIGTALVQKYECTEDDYTTAFIFNVTIGLLLYLIFFFTAPLIADFYATPILKSITRVYTLSLIIDSLSLVNRAKLTIKFDFKTSAIVQISSLLISGITGVILAISGVGVWTLVFYSLLDSFLRFIFFSCFCRWIPRGHFSVKIFKEIYSFGIKLLISNLVTTVYNNMYALVIGKKLSADKVGLYNRGKNFAEVCPTITGQIILRVVYPLFSEYKNDREKVEKGYLKILSLMVFWLFPLQAGLFILSPAVIRGLLGEKWLFCIPIMQFLCAGAVWTPLLELIYNLFNSKKMPQVMLRFDLIQMPAAIAILIATIPFGLEAMCLFKSIFSFLSYFVSIFIVRKFAGISVFKQFRVFVTPLLANIVMALSIYFCILFISSDLLKIFVGIIVGVVTYVLPCYIIKADALLETIHLIIRKK